MVTLQSLPGTIYNPSPGEVVQILGTVHARCTHGARPVRVLHQRVCEGVEGVHFGSALFHGGTAIFAKVLTFMFIFMRLLPRNCTLWSNHKALFFFSFWQSEGCSFFFFLAE